MPFVMVPVPEELAPQVEFLLFQLKYRNTTLHWTDELMGQHLVSLAEEPRLLLSAVAASVTEARDVDDVELAEFLGVSVREVHGIVQEANEVTVAAQNGELLVSRIERVVDDEGRPRSRHVLTMLLGAAQMVRAQETILGLPRAAFPNP